ncbi:MAG: alpha/beta hydrolase [Acidimicrobiales bacterium]|nr:alpha/beta hydrolase [Hyphomonadaceae bacterium]RZV35993.1 MAG: alpha/beta hydrolase [Acidimicrobiales bacterium]
MKKMLKWAMISLLALIVLGLALSYAPDTDKDAMLAKYGGDQARFATMANGLEVHYRDQGPADAPVVVMIHGMSSHLQTWEPLITEIGDDFRILSLDLPGFGLTGPNPDGEYGPEVYIEAVMAVMDAANEETAVIMGNSMGGWTAWRMGVSHPERIEGLVLLDPWGAPGEDTEKSNMAFKLMQSPVGKALMPYFTPKAMVKQSVLQTVEKDEIVTDEMVDRYYELTRYPGNRRAAVKAMERAADLSPWSEIGQLTMPILIMWGREDQLIDVSRADTFAEALTGEELIIYEGVGHLPMEEIPADVARDFKHWWTGVTSQSGSLE